MWRVRDTNSSTLPSSSRHGAITDKSIIGISLHRPVEPPADLVLSKPAGCDRTPERGKATQEQTTEISPSAVDQTLVYPTRGFRWQTVVSSKPEEYFCNKRGRCGAFTLSGHDPA